MKRLIIVVACLLAAACTTTNTKTAMQVTAPPAGARILLVKPDVQLSLLTAVGMTEAREDWSLQGETSLQAALQTAIAGSSHHFVPFDPQTGTEGQVGQLLRLNNAVAGSIREFEYGVWRLPTKEGRFDWTLGEGARALAETQGADYALFVTGRGTYASSARMATFVVASAFGVGIPLGQQVVHSSLVDLRTGQVVWFNVAIAGPNADMRSPEGAQSLVESLLKDAPL